jgi:thiamine-phosphate pyrophosphorylase
VRADAVVLSPVFATRSHPGATPLGPLRFRLLARRAGLPVIALGGMDARRARRIGATRWAAIDGLIPEDS